MELIGGLFVFLFFSIFGVYAIVALFGVLTIFGLMYLIPDEKRPAAKLAGCVILGLASIVLLMSV